MQMRKNVKPLSRANRKLAREWHPVKNAPLTPRDVAPNTSRKVWWRCDKGHEWEAAIVSRNQRGSGCPLCSGKRVRKENCLMTVDRRLAREWHPTLNAPLAPRDVTAKSARKVWWRCARGHKWESPVVYRRKSGSGCPYCAGHRASEETSLQAVMPALAAEWHPTKNAPLTPAGVTSHVAKTVWWTCRKGHEWKAVIRKRTAGLGCPYCAENLVSKDYCLQTVKPELAAEWHPVKNAPLTPQDVYPSSYKEAWWVCQKGHEWKSVIKDRKKKCGCPYCSGRRPVYEQCLETLSPSTARDWHPTKNGQWSPKDVAPHSERQVWWKCGRGHVCQEPVKSRYKRGGCPVCSLKAGRLV